MKRKMMEGQVAMTRRTPIRMTSRLIKSTLGKLSSLRIKRRDSLVKPNSLGLCMI